MSDQVTAWKIKAQESPTSRDPPMVVLPPPMIVDNTPTSSMPNGGFTIRQSRGRRSRRDSRNHVLIVPTTRIHEVRAIGYRDDVPRGLSAVLCSRLFRSPTPPIIMDDRSGHTASQPMPTRTLNRKLNKEEKKRSPTSSGCDEGSYIP
jgi:hypothetical protein